MKDRRFLDQRTFNLLVTGSNPVRPTTTIESAETQHLCGSRPFLFGDGDIGAVSVQSVFSRVWHKNGTPKLRLHVSERQGAMASFDKRGEFWRAQIRRNGYPLQSRTFDTKPETQAWARSIESDMDRGTYRDNREAENTTLAEALDRYGREFSSRKHTPTGICSVSSAGSSTRSRSATWLRCAGQTLRPIVMPGVSRAGPKTLSAWSSNSRAICSKWPERSGVGRSAEPAEEHPETLRHQGSRSPPAPRRTRTRALGGGVGRVR